ncbi:hypothetical protein BT96DRAFT_991502 [Gymnopus androsaceus JB14]|uniref:RING-type domain-containing protein n=1 Tax=Gymnopus androsaceus JB14 TaxID=1447944 RepID=A0A6A4HXT7_9AGAR|nr:hypothetical protein BT96DRAFT_991502 [Gymnopus androsaceus JB14]
MSAPPATPQRASQNHKHSHSVSVSFPQGLSPASPYTPLSLRSFASASTSSGPSPSSTLATPASVRNFNTPPVVKVKRISWASPSPAGQSPDGLPSLADLARNWRTKASENGIHVSNNAKHDEYSLMDEGDVSLASEQEEVLLPAPFMSTHRRRALSHAGLAPQYSMPLHAPHSEPRARQRPPLAPLSPETRRIAPSSPVQARRPSLANHQNVMATPPPNRQLAERLRLKGSFTDPAQPRRREAFDAVPPQNDVSFDRDLFDIHEDENDEEYELSYDSYHHDLHDYHYQPDHRGNVRETHSDIEEEQYEVEYPTFPSQSQYHQYQYQQQQQLLPPTYTTHQPTYSHPPGLAHPAAARGLAYPAMGQLLGLPMYHQAQVMSQYPMHLAPAHFPMEGSLPAPSKVPSKVSTPIPTPLETTIPKSCSICARKPPNLTRLAILAPCGHALCPSCLTSALNIVGEKDMECAGCRGKVADFKLVSITADEGASAKSTTSTANATSVKPQVGVFDNMLSTPDGDHSFDFGSMNEPDFFSDGGIRASTPPPKARGARRASSSAVDVDKKDGHDTVVLRIDNVPWVSLSLFKLALDADVTTIFRTFTPPRISAWLGQPVVRVHVLLDRKGKTMSHAFVEVENETIAGKILRGEVESTGLRTRENSWLRSSLRGLAVSMDLGPLSQESIMIVSLLLGEWTDDRERRYHLFFILFVRLMLISSKFHRCPSTPFISVLAKFPADIDSRVFWTSSLRDLLFDAVFAAIQVLVARIEQRKSESDDGAKKLKSPVSFNKEPARPSSASGSSSGHSSASSHSGSADPTDADVEDEDGENDADGDAFLSDDSGSRVSSDSELRTPSSATAANSTTSSPSPSSAPAPAPAASPKIICSTILLESLESKLNWLKL